MNEIERIFALMVNAGVDVSVNSGVYFVEGVRFDEPKEFLIYARAWETNWKRNRK